MADDPLVELRREIDRIDEAMHGLLMERGSIIDRLIAVKRLQGPASGSAFRPDREAAMLRVLAQRHRGRLPLDAVEGIWRVIISTFTFVQAPFSVHACGPVAAIRDTVRFHFGFTVPFREAADPAAVIAAVAGSGGDLGLVPVAGSAEPWWRALEPPGAPKLIARLPFVEREAHPAGTPVLVLARVASGSAAGNVALYSASSGSAAAAARALGGEVVAEAAGRILLALPASVSMDEIAGAATSSGAPEPPAPIGHHPARFRVSA